MTSLSINNPFIDPIQFEIMKIAFRVFEERCNNEGNPDSVEKILSDLAPFSESELLLSAVMMRLNAMAEIIEDPDYSDYVLRITDSKGNEGLEVHDAFLYACANSTLDDDMSFVKEDVLRTAAMFSTK